MLPQLPVKKFCFPVSGSHKSFFHPLNLSKDCNSLECVNDRFASLNLNKDFAIHVVDPAAL